MSKDDSILIKRFEQGDESAFTELLNKYKQQIYNIVHKMVHDKEWAEEITVEIFVELYQSLERFKERSSFFTWLYRVTVNVCLEQIRKKGREFKLKPKEVVEELASTDSSITEILERRDLNEQVHTAIQNLPPYYRAVAILYYIEEMSPKEIAKALGIPAGTVKSRVFRALQKLREKLGSPIEELK